MTYRQAVRELALQRHGYITTRAAREINVPPVELRKLASRGALVNRGYGVYRLTDAPTADMDQFAEVVYRIGEDAYLMGETVLAIYNLALVNPKKIQILSSRRVRAQLPPFVEIINGEIEPNEITTIEGIPATTVEKALRDCKTRIMPARFKEAVNRALKEGLMTEREAKGLFLPTNKKTTSK
jgi:predicted transcriptional regulator of viral defense system